MKQKRKLRIFISNTAFPAKDETAAAAGAANPAEPAAPATPEGSSTTCWELRVEGRLIDEDKKVKKVFTKNALNEISSPTLNNSPLLCISTSFQVLRAPESWSKYFFSAVFNLFFFISNIFRLKSIFEQKQPKIGEKC